MKFYYVYILKRSDGKFYTGYSADLKTRLKAHEFGKVNSTKNFRPVVLIHYEAYTVSSDAKRREKFLKTTEGKKYLKKQIRDLLAVKQGGVA